MGNLRFFDLGKYKGFDTFIETGTGEGLSVEYVNDNFDFRTVCSIECVDSLFQKARDKFKDIQGVVILKGISWQVLELVLPTQPGKCIFWLDAHLPGVDYNLAEWFDEKDPDIRMPLIKELETIKRLRHGEDVILIDDLSFYVQGEFGSGNLPKELITPGYGSIMNMFKETHDIKVFLDDEGYLEITPKGLFA